MTQPLILSIDTSGADAGLALGHAGRVDALRLPRSQGGQSRTEELAGCAARLLAARGFGPADVSVLGAVVGPGSYTGLRSGLAFVRGLAFAKSLPAVAVGTLELLAWRGTRDGETALIVCAAGPGRAVVAPMRREASDVAGLEAPRLLEDDASLCAVARGHSLVVVAPPIGAVLADTAAQAAFELREVAAEGGLEELARLVESRWCAGRSQHSAELLPVYVGQSTARPNRHRVAVLQTPE